MTHTFSNGILQASSDHGNNDNEKILLKFVLLSTSDSLIILKVEYLSWDKAAAAYIK